MCCRMKCLQLGSKCNQDVNVLYELMIGSGRIQQILSATKELCCLIAMHL